MGVTSGGQHGGTEKADSGSKIEEKCDFSYRV